MNTVYLKNMRNVYKGYVILVAIFLLTNTEIAAQDFKTLVNKAWDNNLLLKSANSKTESANQMLNDAKALYGPTLSFGVQYSLASGGRSILFPVGDLLNPVYSTLNSLTSSNAFPQIENVQTQFLPNNFYDARFRMSLPIFYPELSINKQLKEEVIQMKKLEYNAIKRMICKEVMNSYFQLEAAKDAIAIFKSADTLLNEAKRTTQSMLKNGIALPTALSRIEDQIASLEAQKIEAEANYQNAFTYYKFITGESELPDPIKMPEFPKPEEASVSEREEITQVSTGIKMQNLAISKENQFYTPKVGLQVDLGSQAFDFKYKPYALLGLNFEVNIYDSKRHRYRSESLKAEMNASNHQSDYLKDQIAMQIEIALQNLNSTILQAKTYATRIAVGEKAYQEVFRKYREGKANYLELIDAQTQTTQIKLQYAIAKKNAWIKWAEFVYASAAFPID